MTEQGGRSVATGPDGVVTTGRGRKPLPSLRTRILTVFLGTIIAVCLTITVVFNTLVNRYVSSTATAQLSTVVAGFTTITTGEGEPKVELPDVSQAAPSPLNTRPAVFLLTPDFTAITPSDKTTASQLAELLRQKNLDLTDVHNLLVTSPNGSYYISCVPAGPAGHFVFYIDVTGIVNFAANVNFLLIVIMLAAVVIAILATTIITRRMTRPLADLTEFSERLGAGNFAPCVEEFHDREFATLADSMNQAAYQLDSYDKDQKTFFQNASHELRTPLMSITCYAEGIVYGIMDPQQAGRTILSETGRLSELVEDLLTISRIDSIAGEQRLVQCDVKQILALATEEQRRMAEERGLTVTSTADDHPVVLQGNDRTLHRAFSNLLSNAVRYATSRITVSCHKEAGHVVVGVEDDGGGIAPEDLPHIFERFYQGDGGHHGIGLSIVKSVVDQHGGGIDVRSDPSGTSFRLTFPADAG